MPQKTILELMREESAPQKSVLDLMREEGEKSKTPGVGDIALGTVELAATAATGAVAGMGGLGWGIINQASRVAPWLVNKLTGGGSGGPEPFKTPISDIEEEAGRVAAPLTYRPKSVSGQQAAGVLSLPFEGLHNAADTISGHVFPQSQEARKGLTMFLELAAQAPVFGAGRALVKTLVKGNNIPKAVLLKNVKNLPEDAWKIIEMTDEQRLNDALREMIKTSARKPGEIPTLPELGGTRIERGAGVPADELMKDNPALNKMFPDISPIVERAKGIKEVPVVPDTTPESPILRAMREESRSPAEKPTGAPAGRGGFIEIGKTPKRVLTAAEKKIIDQVEPEPGMLRAGYEKLTSGLSPKNLKNQVDQFSNLDAFERQLQKHGGKKLGVEESAYGQASLYSRVQGILDVELMDLRDRLDPLARVPGGMEDFTQYKITLRDINRAGREFKNPGNVSMADAALALRDFRKGVGEAKWGLIEKENKQFTDWHDKTIVQRLADSGVISDETATKVRLNKDEWFPYKIKKETTEALVTPEDVQKYIGLENLEDGAPVGKKIGEALFRLEGTVKKIENPWKTLMERHALAVKVAEKNKVFQNVVTSSRGNEWGESVIFRVKDKKQPLPDDYGVFNPVFNGVAEAWAAPKDIISDLNHLTARQMDFVSAIMTAQKRGLTAGATAYYVPFSIANFLRDIQSAMTLPKYTLLSAGPVKGVKNLVLGFADAFSMAAGHPSEMAKAALKNKGGYGGLINRELGGRILGTQAVTGPKELLKSSRLRAVESTAKALNPFYDLKVVASTIEMGPRMALFRTALEKGAPKSGAAWNAVQGTVNFSRRGTPDNRVLEIARNFVPFLQARTNTKVATIEAAMGAGRWGPTAAKTAFRVAATVQVPALLAQIYNLVTYPDLYKDIPQADKDKYFCIVKGEKTNPDTGKVGPDYIKIPKGDFGSLLYNPVQHAIDNGFYKEPLKVGLELAKFANELSPAEFMKGDEFSAGRLASGMLPPMVKAPLESAMGKNLYFGSEIVPNRLKGIEPREQYKRKPEYKVPTPELYKKIGAVLNVSPLHLQNIARNFGGSVAALGFEPGQILERVKTTSVGQPPTGGAPDEVYTISQEAEQGYKTAKVRAERMVNDGNIVGAVSELMKWDTALGSIIQRLGEAANQPPESFTGTPWFKKYSFDQKEIRRVIEDAKKRSTGKSPSYMEQQLRTTFK